MSRSTALFSLPLIASLVSALPAADARAADAGAAPNHVSVLHDARGFKLQVDGKDFFVYGMNWDYMPVGENYTYSLWKQPDDYIRAALDREMRLLRAMGVNAVRQYEGPPPRWITYIYEKYGIYTVLNHTVGRYGFNIDGVWQGQVNYQDPRTREVLKADVMRMVRQYENTPGVLMWLLGNESNYGLAWGSAEIDALPVGEREAGRAAYLYSLFGEVIASIKARDPNHPVAIANGDLQYIDLIAKHCKGLDVMGANVYRGQSAGDLFEVVQKKLDVPFMFTEFGSDAYNAKEMHEDQLDQALDLHAQWQEIYEQSYGKGRVGNAIGGMIFQWSDGWWKTGQTVKLDTHETTASWPNGAYRWDYVEGANNMNEEWWGICAKTPRDARGFYENHPRASYYVLREDFKLPVYAETTTLEVIRKHFGSVDPYAWTEPYDLRQGVNQARDNEKLRISTLRLDMATIGNSGRESLKANKTTIDHLESLYAGVTASPSDALRAEATVNVLGHVPTNPIDEIFYEKQGQPRTFKDATGQKVVVDDMQRVRVYNASVNWEDKYLDLYGFYRVGHYHWGYEGDFFGLYPEANYGPNLDLYNGKAPLGVELTGKREIDGLKLAVGPELWWGANPTIIGKYSRKIGDVEVTLIHQEDIAQQTGATTSFAIPEPKTRKTTLAASGRLGPFGYTAGVIMAGSTKLGEQFLAAKKASGRTYQDSGYYLLQDRIDVVDTLGAKLKLTLEHGRYHWYVQSAVKGLVADGGADPTMTFTGWTLKEDGRGNQYNALAGVAIILGDWVVAPNLLFQKPFVGPLPPLPDYFNPTTGVYYPAVRPRNVFHDPFAVLGNRETYAAEMLVAWDPTPETSMWAWDNDFREDAPLAASWDFTYRVHPTSRDAMLGFDAFGNMFAFGAAPPARNLWEAKMRLVSHFAPEWRAVGHVWTGTAEPNGDSLRLVRRFGLDLRVTWANLALSGAVKLHDYGPYDYHRDFNLTYPLQLMGDISYAFGGAKWLTPAQTRFGLMSIYRTLNVNSPGYLAPATGGTPRGHETEVRTYVQLAL